MKTLNPNNRNPRYEGLPYDTLAKLILEECEGVAKPYVEVGVGNNTVAFFVRVAHDDPQKIAVKYHDTIVAHLYDDDRVMLNSAGWSSKSTKERMDWCLLPLGYRLTSVNRTWKVYSIKTGAYKDFFNGMVVGKGDF